MIIQPKSAEELIPGLVTVTIKCSSCGSDSTVEMTTTEFNNRYYHQLSIRSALPNHTATEREKLTSSLCEACQKNVFG